MAKTSRRAIESDMRLSAILAKRVTGMSLKQIGLEENPPVSMQRVAQLISRAVSELVAEPLEQVRRMELLRLDKLLGAVWEGAMGGDVACVDRALQVMARRSRLLGLDKQVGGYAYGRDGEEIDPATVRVEIVGNPAVERTKWLEDRVRSLEASIAGDAPPSSTIN